MKKGIEVKAHPLAGLSIFLLVALFALMSLVTVLLSVRSYAGIADDLARDSETALLTGYLQAKVRSGDAEDALFLTEMDGRTVLQIRGEGSLRDLVYAEGGSLREQWWDSAEAFDPALGETIAPAQRFTGRIEQGLLTLTVTDGQGQTHSVVSALRAAGGEAP